MAGSTGGMAVLLLLCSCLSVLPVPATATLRIYQTRVTYVPTTTTETFPVEGVATVSIGGHNLPDFVFDCNNTKNNGSGIQWSRQGGSEISTEPGTITGLRLLLQNLVHDDLDVYTCTDTFTGESVSLNITDANPAICPVENMKITQVGRQVQMEVYVSSYPLPTGNQIRWYRQDTSEILEDDPNVQFANSRRTLILDNLQLANFGIYQIDFTLNLGLLISRARTEIFLDIQVPPIITMQPMNVTTVSEQEMFSLTCTASGNPPPSITWERENNVPLNVMYDIDPPSINPGSPVSFVTSTLSVPSSLYTDSGRYRCFADNSILAPVHSDFAEIIVRPTLSLSASANDQPLNFSDVISQPDGSAFAVVCRGSGALMWLSSDGVPISYNQTENVYQAFDSIGEAVTLTFKSFSSSQVDMYTCQSNIIDASNLPITDTILVTNSDPAVFIVNDVEYVLNGHSVSIEAGIFSSTTPAIRWFLDGVLLNIDSNSQLNQIVSNSLYTLNIDNVSPEYVGVYTVEVTHSDQTTSDSINVTYATPPTVSVSQTELEVSEGDDVRIQCLGTGVGVISTRWFYNNEETPFQSGDDLVISSVTSSNAGQYECRVSNIAATVNMAVQIRVKYMPFSMIRYNSISSMSNPVISAVFGENTVAPIFMCISDGYPVPTITWRATRDSGFPNGVKTQNGEQELVWTRQLEYTDSMQYECVSENELGMSITTMDLLVQSPPRIDSIYSSHLSSDMPNNFQVATGFTGLALTCLAFGWPTPHVEWLFENGALPDGVVSSKSILPHMGQVSANLRFKTGYNSSFNGAYQCIVRENELSDVALREQRQLFESNGMITDPPLVCAVNSASVNFQVRILETDCTSWGDSLRESISNAFEDDIARIIQMECNCTLQSGFVRSIELPMCSTVVANSVVFRGTIETNSADLTERAYCALSNWQQSSPSININSQMFTVDSGCFLRVDSLSNQECSSGGSGALDTTTLTIVIAAPLGVVVLVFVVVVLILSCVCCCCKSTKKETWRPKDVDNSSYSRTDIRYGVNNHVIAPTVESAEVPVYASLNRNIYSPNSQPPLNESPDHLPLRQTGSLSKEWLLRHNSGDHESIDGDIRQTAIDSPIPNGGGQFPYAFDSRPSTGLSGRVISPPQNSPRNVISATNPIAEYETLDHNYRGSPTNSHPLFSHRTSSSDNASDRKFSLASSVTTGTGTGTLHSSSVGRDDVFINESGSQLRSTVPHQSPVSTAYLRNMNSRSSIDHHSASPAMSSRPSEIIDEEERRNSNCSEEPPPYSSRPPSLGIAPSNSMLDNSAYGRINPPASTAITSEGDQHWYMQSSDASLNSARHETRPINQVNGRSSEIVPYASIHNSAIPYEPHTVRTKNEHKKSVGSASPRFRVSANIQRHCPPQPQPYTEAINSQPDSTNPQHSSDVVPEGIAPQPYSEAVSTESNIDSLSSQGAFEVSRDVSKFGRITTIVV